MGLGKTVECVAILLDHIYSTNPATIKPPIITVPTNTIQQWALTIKQWATDQTRPHIYSPQQILKALRESLDAQGAETTYYDHAFVSSCN